jgi:ABC-2 type transport system permease protein
VNYIGIYSLLRQEFRRFTRVGIQAFFTPWITALLYILIFGKVVGVRIGEISGVSYIDFVIPGLLMMNIMQAAFMQSSSSLYFRRFLKNIDELLTAPLSAFEIIISFLLNGVIRSLIVGGGVYIIALFFTATSVERILLSLFYIVGVSITFSLAGLLVGLWSEHFEHLSIPQTFVIIPLSFLGGMFNSVSMLPEKFQMAMYLNPFFYFVDGLRYSMIGVSESDRLLGVFLISSLVFLLGFWVWYLFQKGYKLRS